MHQFCYHDIVSHIIPTNKAVNIYVYNWLLSTYILFYILRKYANTILIYYRKFL